MDELPKRDDDIYQEIDSFEDYELTNCVAYEMAIRDIAFLHGIIELVEYVNSKFLQFSTKEALIDNIKVVDDWGASYRNVKLCEMNLKCDLRDFDISEQQVDNLFKIKQIQDYKVIQAIKEEHIIDKLNVEILNIQRNDGYIITQFGDLNEEVNSPPLNNIITADFKRPYLRSKNGKHAEIELNLALPKEELIAYIAKIKDGYDKNTSTIKTPLELLGETLNAAMPQKDYPKKPTASKMADMFFIYDYVKARRADIDDANTTIKAEYDEQVSYVSKNKDLTTKEKKIQKAELYKEYLQNTIDTKITDIFNEDELTEALNLKGDNISKLYYAIKPYIDDLKYKELITGVSTI